MPVGMFAAALRRSSRYEQDLDERAAIEMLIGDPEILAQMAADHDRFSVVVEEELYGGVLPRRHRAWVAWFVLALNISRGSILGVGIDRLFDICVVARPISAGQLKYRPHPSQGRSRGFRRGR